MGHFQVLKTRLKESEIDHYSDLQLVRYFDDNITFYIFSALKTLLISTKAWHWGKIIIFQVLGISDSATM